MIIGYTAGVYDLFHIGHLNLLRNAKGMCDKLIVGVLRNSAKNSIFTMEERVSLINKTLSADPELKNVEVVMFEGLLVDFVKSSGASTIVRGLRAVSDYEYELQMAMLNKHMDESIDTIFFMTDIKNSFLSSSIIKDVAKNGGNISGLVPEVIIDDVKNKMSE